MIDLSSDTATKPSEGMKRAMMAAEVGDEQRREDPTTNALQERVAGLLGKECALFLPSATMGNLAALRAHLRPGEGFIADARCHIVRWEAGGYAAVAGASPTLLTTERGVFTGRQMTEAVAPDGQNFAPTRLVCAENTHNAGGGTVWTVAETDAMAQAARGLGLSLHLDGARLLNAAAALEVAPHVVAAPFDSVTLCLSKGLGCPMGAVLAGSQGLIDHAWRSKQMLGGSLRQSGMLAAAGLYALKCNVERLREDQENAQMLAQGLAEMRCISIDKDTVQSNLVFFTVGGMTAQQARKRLMMQGVRVSGDGERLRAVTHLDIARRDIPLALAAMRAAWEE